MDKYTERILDEIHITFENHYTDYEDRNDFLNDVLKAVSRIQDNLEDYDE
jgi:hypothetical protein